VNVQVSVEEAPVGLAHASAEEVLVYVSANLG